MNRIEKPLMWMGSSKKDLISLPRAIQQLFGYALNLAQIGEKANDAKPLKGFGSAGVLEVIEDLQGNTYRAVYTVKFHDAVYVLHCFQKKSTSGIATPKSDMELIKSRLKMAELLSKQTLERDKNDRVR
ncbi:type II toxin-antitoxin system RelE/ParE family toxin [Hafnia paralvei]|uniref:type II toxin-antitoxin system RelE/ParE family toxin n=1 Tax=Hafnia paralvei TaxID=546367 RepID=UPI0020327C1C|nr:type II toxin-antitoxin system RelE/ParE family toxin [Hafnia paralvei]